MNPITIVTTGLSIAGAVSSAYLWVLQRQREAPRLRLHVGRRPPRHAGLYAPPGQTMLDCHVEVELLVTNLSAQPDVLTGLRLRIKSNEAGWLHARRAREPYQTVDEYTRLPIPMPPRSSVRLFLRLSFEVPEGVEPQLYLASPLQLEGTLLGLGGRTHHVRAAAPESR
jgi:hypothetical protein